MTNSNGSNKHVWTVLGVVAGFAANIISVFAAWNSLSNDVAVVKEQVAGVRDNVNRHETEITKLRDARAEAKRAAAAGEPAA